MCESVDNAERYFTIKKPMIAYKVVPFGSVWGGVYRCSAYLRKWSVPVKVRMRNHIEGDKVKHRETLSGYHVFATRDAAEAYIGADTDWSYRFQTIPVRIRGRAISFFSHWGGYVVEQWSPYVN